ncbi:right-handed parallel beta-helix repeat-containing protein [Chryseobacterium daecheongense]|uniref:Parallel beta helix pectate lyase-like protein n=1 Tax=Chryseobacterium daecheongense TaxID=192389 RepID=A0A3N0W4T8_9FLAO|nr:right-handed parallel beta-helix repeat-containing protein [Chryseobacterium daecheongense]ROI00033.1 right-handed parallel beta-helix repeat-containing protein [Chryseobacterium daecheongense]TDX95030.1 parallel beta helix pectate lyase-like protein [Chryseobacterium daecheongense]
MIYTEDFFAPGNTYPNDNVVELVDSYTGEHVIYKKTTVGVPTTGDGDGAIYRKKGTDFYKREWTGYVNILWWGIGNTLSDYTETTTRIQKAVALGYDTFFDEISIVINDSLPIQSNQKLFSKGCSIKQSGFVKEIFNCENKSNISIIGFSLEGLGTDYQPSSSSKAVGILCYGAQNLIIENNIFKDFTYSGVSGLRDVNHLSFNFNRVENSFDVVWAEVSPEYPFGKKDNTGITVGGKNISILKNSFKNTSQGIIIAENSEFISISDNDIENTILEHGMYLDAGLSNLTVLGNRIKNTKKIGIKLQNNDANLNYICNNVVISNNVISDTDEGGDGILVNNTSLQVDPITLEIIYMPTIFAKNVVISGNIVKNAGQHGINVRFIDGGVVANNMVNDSMYSGIYIAFNKGVDICHNNIHTTQESGIMIESNNDFLNVNSNTIDNPGVKNAGGEDFLTGITIRQTENYEIAVKHNKIRGNTIEVMRWGIFIEGNSVPNPNHPENDANQETFEIENNIILKAKYTDLRFLNGFTKLRRLRDNYKTIQNSPGEQP